MKRLLICVPVVLGLFQDVFCQTIDWTVRSENTGPFPSSKNVSVVTDNLDNVYTAGYFSDSVDFDPGPGLHALYASSSGNDLFVQKLNSIGDLEWVVSVGRSVYGEEPHDMKIDEQGNLYIVGEFYDVVDFDPGPGVHDLTAFQTALNGDGAYILKLDSDGDFVWAKALQAACNSCDAYFYATGGNKIDLDNTGNLYIGGDFRDSVDFDPSGNTLVESAIGGIRSSFIEKLDANGNFEWVKLIDGSVANTGAAAIRDITVDENGNQYIQLFLLGFSQNSQNWETPIYV